MSLSVSDVASVYSAIANVGLFMVGSLSLLLAYSQISSWQRQKTHDRTESIIDSAFDSLVALRSAYIDILVAEYHFKETSAYSVPESYKRKTKSLANMRPEITNLELIKIKQPQFDRMSEVSAIIDETVKLWDSERAKYSQYNLFSMALYSARTSNISQINFTEAISRSFGVVRVAAPPEERYLSRARSTAVVQSMDALVDRIAQVVRSHSMGNTNR